MEWTLDVYRLAENPFMTPAGQAEIRALARACGVGIHSLTGDCFMQAPFHKAAGSERSERLQALRAVIGSCTALKVRYLVFPLVDAGRLETPEQERDVQQTLAALDPELERGGICVVFESDYPPERLTRFIDAFPARRFGVNYDIGNSASQGFDPEREFAAYGPRILNVHVKDRALGGTTVPLGTGNADFPKVFAGLARLGYRGNYILQTARAADDDHAGVLCRYRDMVCTWLDQTHGS
jgi:hexulose-6-phosphate isomerase